MYVLSLETINSLSITYRVEAFTFLICNAWELLLKARIIELIGSNEAIYYPKKRGEKRRTLALRDCIKKIISDEKDPMRRNIERIADLRDDAVHLVIRTLPRDVLALFQSCVLNYHRLLGDWFTISLSDRVPVGMMSIVYDLGPEHFDLNNPKLRKQLGKDAAEYLAKYRAELLQESASLGNVKEFLMGIEYRLALVKRVGDADIVLSNGTSGNPLQVLEVPKDSSKTHPYRRTEVVLEINNKLAGRHKITSYDIQCVVDHHKIKSRTEFFYQGAVRGSPPQYSVAFVDWCVEQFERDSGYFGKMRPPKATTA